MATRGCHCDSFSLTVSPLLSLLLLFYVLPDHKMAEESKHCIEFQVIKEEKAKGTYPLGLPSLRQLSENPEIVASVFISLLRAGILSPPPMCKGTLKICAIHWMHCFSKPNLSVLVKKKGDR